jgi:hypothetical protein
VSGDPFECPEVDAALAELGSGSGAPPDGAIERALEKLLDTFGGPSAGAADGIPMLREDVTPVRYFAVGTVWMLTGGNREPFCFDLLFTPARDFSAGPLRSRRRAIAPRRQ